MIFYRISNSQTLRILASYKVIILQVIASHGVAYIWEPLPQIHLHAYKAIGILRIIAQAIRIMKRKHILHGLEVVSAAPLTAGVHNTPITAGYILNKP